jgi:(S)-2-hydroxyglutarate dehydrogenase
MQNFDLIIIGAGIIGAATAWQLKLQYPAKTILLLEKEAKAALHQTGRNSGVVHAGVYYPPSSLKAQFCKQGLAATQQFCQDYKLPYQQTGKLLVATNALELQRMEALYLRCEQNQLKPQLMDENQLRQCEPNISGEGAILVKDTAITNYTAITTTMLSLFADGGGQIAFAQSVQALDESDQGIVVSTPDRKYKTKQLINCAGLMTDKLSKMIGLEVDFQILPFRGEYFKLPPKYNEIVRHLIYPIPDPELPFLGVHLTRMIDGSVTVGPNAVLAMAREGYGKFDFNLGDVRDMLGFSGFWPLLGKQATYALQELKNSWFKRAYLAQVQKYCPQIVAADLLPHPSGIRAQAVTMQGELIHDFKFLETEHSLHVGNAPSPAATSAIPIALHLINKIREKLA